MPSSFSGYEPKWVKNTNEKGYDDLVTLTSGRLTSNCSASCKWYELEASTRQTDGHTDR